MSISLNSVLARHNLDLTATDVARGLDAALEHFEALGWTRADAGHSSDFLREHGGIPEAASPTQVQADAVARHAVASAHALTTGQVARLLSVDPSRVRHRILQRRLYAVPARTRERRLPTWQFVGGEVLPGLPEVLTAVPVDLHPLEVAGFMLTSQPELEVDGNPVSPRDWLLHGGNVSAVAALAATLGQLP